MAAPEDSRSGAGGKQKIFEVSLISAGPLSDAVVATQA
jgi:hypothetical protein